MLESLIRQTKYYNTGQT